MDLFCQSCRLLAQTSHPRKKYGSVTKPAMLWPRPFPRLVALARGNTFLLSAQHGQERCYWGQVATASPLQSMMQAGACVEGIQQCWGIEGLLILGLLSLELPFQLAKPIYPKNCQLKIRQVQWERGGEGERKQGELGSFCPWLKHQPYVDQQQELESCRDWSREVEQDFWEGPLGLIWVSEDSSPYLWYFSGSRMSGNMWHLVPKTGATGWHSCCSREPCEDTDNLQALVAHAVSASAEGQL